VNKRCITSNFRYDSYVSVLILQGVREPRTRHRVRLVLKSSRNNPYLHPSYAISTDAERATEPSMKQTPDEHSAECNGRTDAHSLYARLHSVILISFKARNTYEIYFDANKRYS